MLKAPLFAKPAVPDQHIHLKGFNTFLQLQNEERRLSWELIKIPEVRKAVIKAVLKHNTGKGILSQLLDFRDKKALNPVIETPSECFYLHHSQTVEYKNLIDNFLGEKMVHYEIELNNKSMWDTVFKSALYKVRCRFRTYEDSQRFICHPEKDDIIIFDSNCIKLIDSDLIINEDNVGLLVARQLYALSIANVIFDHRSDFIKELVSINKTGEEIIMSQGRTSVVYEF